MILSTLFLSEPVVQFNTWVSCDSSSPSLPARRSPKPAGEPVYLEDVQTDKERINSSLLSSESTFLPFASDLEPQALHSDSEDETETFEADSLVLARPSEPKRPGRNQTDNPADKEEGVSAATAATGSAVKVCTPQKDFSKAGVREAPAQEQVGRGVGEGGSMEAEKAAVKIQSCWRGHHARCFHPAAREARGEIRLRRMQEHILFLSDKLDT